MDKYIITIEHLFENDDSFQVSVDDCIPEGEAGKMPSLARSLVFGLSRCVGASVNAEAMQSFYEPWQILLAAACWSRRDRGSKEVTKSAEVDEIIDKCIDLVPESLRDLIDG